jgi:hypothetical protein
MRDEGRGAKLVIYKCIVNTGFSLIPHPSPPIANQTLTSNLRYLLNRWRSLRLALTVLERCLE